MACYVVWQDTEKEEFCYKVSITHFCKYCVVKCFHGQKRVEASYQISSLLCIESLRLSKC